MSSAPAPTPPSYGNTDFAPGCGACFQHKDKLFRCGGCRKIYYCSKECQKADRKGHKPICKLVENEAGDLSGESKDSPVVYCMEKYPKEWGQIIDLSQLLQKHKKLEAVVVRETNGSLVMLVMTWEAALEVLRKTNMVDSFIHSCDAIHKQAQSIGGVSYLLFTEHPKLPTYHFMAKIPGWETLKSPPSPPNGEICKSPHTPKPEGDV